MIIAALPDYYAVHIDKSNPTIVVTEIPIIAWEIEVDQYNLVTPKTPSPITIHGPMATDFVCHPEGTYAAVATGEQFKDKDWFVKVMQDRWDDEQKGKLGGG